MQLFVWNIVWHCLSLGLERKLTFSSPVATAAFSKFAGILSAALSQQIWKTQQGPQDWKRSVFIPIPKKGNAKECSNYHTTALISHTGKVMLKILQARFQQYMNRELPDVGQTDDKSWTEYH